MIQESSPTTNADRTQAELEELRARVEEAEAILEAIRSGAVDALLVSGEEGEKVFVLRGADEPYRIFVENMREGAVTLDSSGTIMYSNRAFADLVGQPLEKVMGAHFGAYMPEAGPINETWQTLGRMEGKLHGQDRTVDVICSVTPADFGGTAVYAVTIIDLTEQKNHEARLRKTTAELEGFCYAVSHDMRAPLRSIVGAASIVMEDFAGSLPPAAQKDLKRIAASANHLGRLMDDLLAYSRLARLEITPAQVDLSEMAHRLAEEVRTSGYDHVEWEIEPGLIVEGDPRLLETALENLFANAAKFSTKSHSPRVCFGWDTANESFYVRDNGIGFDMRYVDKLFMPFERLHRQDEYPGTGIGLANVKRVIVRHGGKVWAEGAEGVGATFFFTLP